MSKPKLPRGLQWRGDSIVAVFALKDSRCINDGHVPDCECGEIERRSLGEASVSWAREQLAIFRRQVSEGKYQKRMPRPKENPIIVTDLWELYAKQYTLKGKKALWRQKVAWAHLKPKFGDMRPDQLSTADLIAYQESRKAEGASNGTINRELSVLSATFYRAAKMTLAGGKRLLEYIPAFPDKLEESAPRQGFIEEPQYKALAAHAKPLWLRAFIECAYLFGFRRGELLSLRARQLDFFGMWLELEPGSTKNKDGRKVKMTTEVFELMKACVRGKDSDDYVFTRENGDPVRDFRDDWYALCVASNLGRFVSAKRANGEEYQRYVGLTPHDFRRSAVRNMIRRGVDETVARKVSGHKTSKIFRLYDITSERDLADATKKIELGRQVSVLSTETDTKTDTAASQSSSDSSQLPRM